jgi:hypothetical protein
VLLAVPWKQLEPGVEDGPGAVYIRRRRGARQGQVKERERQIDGGCFSATTVFLPIFAMFPKFFPNFFLFGRQAKANKKFNKKTS